jgi:hypothetical protein
MNRDKEIADRIARSVTADAEYYKKQLESALHTFAYVPFEYAWNDDGTQRDVKRKREQIESEINDLINMLPIPTKFVVIGLGKPVEFNSEEELVRGMKKLGIRQTGSSPSGGRLRPELWDKPQFDKLLGPMYGGAKSVRYETSAVYDELSK